jgi:hypothetical protein
MSTERPAPRPGTGVRPRIRSSVNARSGREPKEQRPDRGAGRGQTGPAASGYAVLVAPTLSRVPDGRSEGGAPRIRSARAVPGPAPQGVASQRPRAPGRQSPTSCASAARAAFDFAAQSPPTLSIRRYRGWPPQASSSQQGAHPHPRADPLGACDRGADLGHRRGPVTVEPWAGGACGACGSAVFQSAGPGPPRDDDNDEEDACLLGQLELGPSQKLFNDAGIPVFTANVTVSKPAPALR